MEKEKIDRDVFTVDIHNVVMERYEQPQAKNTAVPKALRTGSTTRWRNSYYFVFPGKPVQWFLRGKFLPCLCVMPAESWAESCWVEAVIRGVACQLVVNWIMFAMRHFNVRGIACSRRRLYKAVNFCFRVVKERVCCVKNIIVTLKITKSRAI